MRRSKQFPCFIMSCVLFSTCIVNAAPKGALPHTHPMLATNLLLADEPEPQMETRVYVRRQCILSEHEFRPPPTNQPALMAVLAGIFLPILIEKAFGAASAALKKAGEEETLRDSGRLPTYLYQLSKNGQNSINLNPNLQCVLVVRGSFSGPDPVGSSDITFSEKGVFVNADEESERRRIRRLRDAHIPIVEIAAVYETAINISNDNTALYYEGRFLAVNKFLGGRSANTRAMVVSLAMYGVGSKEGDSILSLALVNLGELKKGAVLGPTQLRSKRTNWLGGLGLSDEAIAAIEKIKPAQITDPIPVMPVTVEGIFIETDKGSKALKFIAEVLDAAKEDVAKAVTAEATKDKEKAAEEAVNAIEKLHLEEEQAYEEYLTAKQELLSEPANPVKKFAVQRTLRVWCNKYRAVTALGEKASGPAADCVNN